MGYLDVFPVKKVTQLQGSAQHHWRHISDDLHIVLTAMIWSNSDIRCKLRSGQAYLCSLFLRVRRVPLGQSYFALPAKQ